MLKTNNTSQKILIYFPSNKRSVAMESMMVALAQRGYKIYFLTICKSGDLHSKLTQYGIQCFAHPLNKNKFITFFLQLQFLVKFCIKENIHVVHSHLQDANIIAVFAQFFAKSKFVIFRHHFNYQASLEKGTRRNMNEVLGEKIINTLSKILVVPSEGVYSAIIEYEVIDKAKLKIVPYIYDFSKYNTPDRKEVGKLIAQYPVRLRLIMVSRFIKPKRHELVFRLINELIQEGYDDLVLFALDTGPEKKKLQHFVHDNNLTDKIIMPGFKNNVIDYMSASHLLIHPSLYDASNSVIKEMGLLKKPVTAVEGIGDFSSYIQNEHNGFLISAEDSYEELKSIIIFAYKDLESLNVMGQNLRNTVLDKFSVSSDTLKPYEELVQL